MTSCRWAAAPLLALPAKPSRCATASSTAGCCLWPSAPTPWPPSRQPPPDPQAIFDYLYFHVIPSPRTIFKACTACRPATARCLRSTASDGGALTGRPLRGAAARTSFDAWPSSAACCIEAVAPARRQQAGCFLSGGTDSSTVAGMIAQVAGRRRHLLDRLRGRGLRRDAVRAHRGRHFGTDHHEYYVTPDDLVRSIPDVAAHYDQPFGNSVRCCRPSTAPRWRARRRHAAAGRRRRRRALRRQQPLCQAARLRLVRPSLPALLRKGLLEPCWARRSAPAAGCARAQLHRAGPRADARPPADVQPAAAPGPGRRADARLLLAHRPGANPLRAAAPSGVGQATRASALNRMLAFDWRYTLAEADLPKVCGTTALAGVAVGFPFLDDELLDFSLSCPPTTSSRA
jgi:asparagine synthase (glutamine-hydrolysing)